MYQDCVTSHIFSMLGTDHSALNTVDLVDLRVKSFASKTYVKNNATFTYLSSRQQPVAMSYQVPALWQNEAVFSSDLTVRSVGWTGLATPVTQDDYIGNMLASYSVYASLTGPRRSPGKRGSVSDERSATAPGRTQSDGPHSGFANNGDAPGYEMPLVFAALVETKPTVTIRDKDNAARAEVVANPSANPPVEGVPALDARAQ